MADAGYNETAGSIESVATRQVGPFIVSRNAVKRSATGVRYVFTHINKSLTYYKMITFFDRSTGRSFRYVNCNLFEICILGFEFHIGYAYRQYIKDQNQP